MQCAAASKFALLGVAISVAPGGNRVSLRNGVSDSFVSFQNSHNASENVIPETGETISILG
jgi:hypothetical protein